ncbi:hypothetical protein LBBP_04351 [Leptospira borgpetersenii serovar Ballum]|uniref:Uncharacterized protein n=1 Tax=Leptospira borgpetersenii serovar Ballum TaxID=280505 RepID=A0A0S2IXR0_LEPBO|nr:hypothetical protein LBBP_04303 [Leptospira borgpetersenii serovar Ballum]ALO28462.1 hypothetical protein LBBP_04351 [Leptospira borgpetersenii serovar Ballum]
MDFGRKINRPISSSKSTLLFSKEFTLYFFNDGQILKRKEL